MMANPPDCVMCMTTQARSVLEGFLDACYDSTPPGVRVRIGESRPDLPPTVWITAFNPLGVVRPDDDNAAAQAALWARIAAVAAEARHGVARSSDEPPTWSEPCAVIANDLTLADTLAREHAQLAIVSIDAAGRVRLRCYRAAWLARFGASDMDAPNVEWVA